MSFKKNTNLKDCSETIVFKAKYNFPKKEISIHIAES